MTPAVNRASNRIGLAARIIWMRLRFVLAVAALFAVVALWQQFGSLWDRTVLWASGRAAAERGVSPDTEYFCPMCPGVLSAWPEKCPVCKMPLVRRTKGQSQLLPEGVTARMQISPYRLQLAGVKTSPVGYLPLEHQIRATGRVVQESSAFVVTAPISPWDMPFVSVGTPVELGAPWLPAGTKVKGKIERISDSGDPASGRQLHIAIADPHDPLTAGASVEMIARVPLASVEPYRSQPRHPAPPTADAKRSYFVCADHPAWIRTQRGKCPFDGRELAEQRLRDDQRLEWSCLLHREVRSPERGSKCPHGDRGCTSPHVVTYVPDGEVLVVPETSVIDAGTHRLVYVETMPGMFDGVVVTLGAKEDGYYPVLAGLEPGQRVATAAAFLLDAETRLNPSLAAGYFGAGSAAGGGTSAVLTSSASPAAQPAPDLLATLKLSPEDLILARRQKVCPITKAALGSMGKPICVEVEGEPVFLCCEACRSRLPEGTSVSQTPADPGPARQAGPTAEPRQP